MISATTRKRRVRQAGRRARRAAEELLAALNGGKDLERAAREAHLAAGCLWDMVQQASLARRAA